MSLGRPCASPVPWRTSGAAPESLWQASCLRNWRGSARQKGWQRRASPKPWTAGVKWLTWQGKNLLPGSAPRAGADKQSLEGGSLKPGLDPGGAEEAADPGSEIWCRPNGGAGRKGRSEATLSRQGADGTTAAEPNGDWTQTRRSKAGNVLPAPACPYAPLATATPRAACVRPAGATSSRTAGSKPRSRVLSRAFSLASR